MEVRITKTIQGDVTMRMRLISDRQNLLERQKLRDEGLMEVMLDRLDMYWVDVSIGDKHIGALSINPSLADPALFTVSWQFTEVDSRDMDELRHMVIGYFSNRPEYKNQVQWMKNLVTAGYGQGSSKVCGICNHFFKVPGKHMHRKFEDKVYPFHPSTKLAGSQEILDENGVSTGMSEKEWRKEWEEKK